MDESILLAINVVLLAVIFGSICVGRFILWPLYASLKKERNMLQERLDAVVRDRDGWRGVAERALLVAQIGKQVSRRATRLVARVGQ